MDQDGATRYTENDIDTGFFSIRRLSMRVVDLAPTQLRPRSKMSDAITGTQITSQGAGAGRHNGHRNNPSNTGEVGVELKRSDRAPVRKAKGRAAEALYQGA